MTSAKRRRERQQARSYRRGKECPGCGAPVVSLGGQWLMAHESDCWTLATAEVRGGRPLLDLDLGEGSHD